MVEEQEDIAKVDLDAIQREAPAAPTPAVAAPTKPAAAKPKAEAASAMGTDEFFVELEKALHSDAFKVAPAAGAWMRSHMILPSEVKATGPKGFIIKTDVLNHIDANNLVVGKRAGGAKPAAAKKQ